MSDLPPELRAARPGTPVLIAGPTASGKSALALALARQQGRTVVNADALQVHADWRVLTARPSEGDEAEVSHVLYGHVPWGMPHSVGHWLREVAPLLTSDPAPVIVGGTGLFLTALTQGLAEVPEVDRTVRTEADDLLARRGISALVAQIDAETAGRIDLQNGARVRRAWEVLKQTGRGLADWQNETSPPLLPRSRAAAFVIEAPKERLSPLIERRFDAMLVGGALDEVGAVLPRWDPSLPVSRAIGAADLVEVLRGAMPLEEARTRAVIATRRYAKRQRTWFRSRMSDWTPLPMASLDGT